MRSPDLPEVYLFQGQHPQRPPLQGQGERTFIVLLDVSEAGKQADVERGKKLEIPMGREEDMSSLYGELPSHRSAAPGSYESVEVLSV